MYRLPPPLATKLTLKNAPVWIVEMRESLQAMAWDRIVDGAETGPDDTTIVFSGILKKRIADRLVADPTTGKRQIEDDEKDFALHMADVAMQQSIKKEEDEYRARRQTCLSHLRTSIDAEFAAQFRNDASMWEDPVSLWAAILTLKYNIKDAYRCIYTLRITNFDNLTAYIAEVRRCWAFVEFVNKSKIIDSERFFYISQAVPEEWHTELERIYEIIGNRRDWAKLVQLLLYYEADLAWEAPHNYGKGRALYTTIKGSDGMSGGAHKPPKKELLSSPVCYESVGSITGAWGEYDRNGVYG